MSLSNYCCGFGFGFGISFDAPLALGLKSPLGLNGGKSLLGGRVSLPAALSAARFSAIAVAL
nr:hypothetical protein [Brasilonema octagenarum HA4186-MV1]